MNSVALKNENISLGKSPTFKRSVLLGQNPFYLGKYYLLNIGVYLSLAVGLILYNKVFDQLSYFWILCMLPLFMTRFRYIISGAAIVIGTVLWNYGSEIGWEYAGLLTLAIYLGALSSVMIHNASHNNFRPLWLNPIIGEFCSLHQLSAGFPVFAYVHREHHIHSDDLEKDPHPSKGYTFWAYVDAGRALIHRRLTNVYLENWGDTEKSKNLWRLQGNLQYLARFAKTLFWFSLLGPKYFAFFLVPSYLGSVFLFASFNYYTHRERPDGKIDILNIDNSWPIKIANRVLFGVFYHKNHHLKPKLFNPMDMR